MGAELGAANALGAGAGTGATGAGIVAEAAPAVEAATAVGGPGAGAAGTQTAMVNAMETAGATPGGITAVPEAATTLAPAGEGAATVAPAGEVQSMTEAQRAYLEASQASVNPSIAQGVKPLPAYSTTSLSPEVLQATGNVPASTYSLTGSSAAPGQGSLQYQLTQPGTTLSNEGLRAGATGGANGITATSPGASTFGNLPPSQPSMFDKFSAFADKHPFMTGAAMYTGAYQMGLLDPRKADMPEKKKYGNQYTMSDKFQASEATPNVYTPSYKTYAEGGGVMSVGGPSSQVMEPRQVINPMATMSAEANETSMPGYAKGGSTLSNSLEFYRDMTAGTKPSTSKGSTAPHMEDDVGIYYDQDPDTRYQDALTAAQIRQSKLDKRANLQLPTSDVMKRPTAMGKLNLAPPGVKAQDGSGATEAAQGGIMQAGSSLGGYAAGGNPRLLKGPGDGMSDNIPAVIGSKQPARLADGEFVIPADVVSHLGNGSTEAGAKRLHEMMSKVRKDRTGNSKQGKQINPNKYMPK